jgi:hypothetical protein
VFCPVNSNAYSDCLTCFYKIWPTNSSTGLLLCSVYEVIVAVRTADLCPNYVNNILFFGGPILA